jgi:very-short-patch-repair endonuclease
MISTSSALKSMSALTFCAPLGKLHYLVDFGIYQELVALEVEFDGCRHAPSQFRSLDRQRNSSLVAGQAEEGHF